MQEYAESWRTSSAPWDEWMETYEALRAEFARFINADLTKLRSSPARRPESIRSPTPLSFDDRNKVVMSEYEFPTMGQIWLAQQPRGAEIQFLDGVNNVVPTECYEPPSMSGRWIVPLTHVSFVNGFRSDVAAITRIAHASGALCFPGWLPGLWNPSNRCKGAGRGLLRHRHAEISAGAAGPGLSVRAPRT